MNSLFRRGFLSLATLLAALSATFGQSISPENKNGVLQSMQNVILRQAFVPGIDFQQWPTFLEKHRADVDKASDTASFTLAVNNALRDFGISHIRLLSPQSARTRVTGQSQGFGFAAQKGERGFEITAIAPQSPAFQLGLEVGDEVVEIEGVGNPTSLAPLADQETALLTIKRKRTGQVKHYMVAKKAYSTDRPNTLAWVSPGIVHVKIPSFARTYNRREIEGFLAEVTQKKAKALVLDLRGNGGGFVANCQHLLSLLSEPGTPTGTSVTRAMAERFAKEANGDGKDMVAVAKWNGPTSKTFKTAQPPYLGKVVILVDKGSASASEITSAVLRERRKAVLVGKPSAGAVLVSIFAPLASTGGFEVQIPIQDYVSPGGMRLEKNPLKPDVVVEAQATTESDPVLEQALKAIR